MVLKYVFLILEVLSSINSLHPRSKDHGLSRTQYRIRKPVTFNLQPPISNGRWCLIKITRNLTNRLLLICRLKMSWIWQSTPRKTSESWRTLGKKLTDPSEHVFASAQILYFGKNSRRCSCRQKIAQWQLSSSISVSKIMDLVERAETCKPFGYWKKTFLTIRTKRLRNTKWIFPQSRNGGERGGLFRSAELSINFMRSATSGELATA